MSSHRMAVRKRISLPWQLVSIWASTQLPFFARATSSSTTFNLGSDITNFIPSCALSCFESFVEVNYDTNQCGSSPSLQCLCSYTGSQGFTLGEGAVQCIVAEDNVGACVGMDAASQVVADGYNMCYGQAGAAPETHATIVATLIVPPSGPVIVPSPATTTVLATTTVGLSTSYTTPSITMTPASTTSSSFSTWTTSSLSSSSTTTAPAAETSAAAPISSSPTLSNTQIAAIAGGGAAAVLFAIVALLMFLRRRKRNKTMSPGFSKMRDSWNPKPKNEKSPNIPQISAPVYREPKQMSYTRALAKRFSLRPETIGLAISPENSTGVPSAVSMPGRPPTFVAAHDEPPPIPPMSPLRQQTFMLSSPTPSNNASKPALTLTIPGDGKRDSGATARRMPFSNGRESVVTEFAEDELDPSSAGAAQIWRPPPTDPQSATTYYVADKWGNWVLGNNPSQVRRSQLVELETPVDKTAAERAQEDMERATVAAAKLPKAPEAAVTRNAPRPGPSTVRMVPPENMKLSVAAAPRSSSVYSNFSLPQTVAPGPGNPMPPRQGPGPSNPRPLRQQPNPEAYYKLTRGDSMKVAKRKSNGRERTQTMMSGDSATTIASSAGSALDGLDDFPLPASEQYSRQSQQQQQQPPQGSLSPVVESPRSPGTSPVSYPRIRRPQSGANGNTSKAAGAAAAVGLRLFPPDSKREYTPPGQPSPTLGLIASKPVQTGMLPVPLPSQAQVSHGPWRPSQNPNPNRNPAQIRTGSPNIPGSDSDQERPLASAESRKPTPPRLETQARGQTQVHGQSRPRVDSRSLLPSQARGNKQNQQQPRQYDQRLQQQSQQPQRPQQQQTQQQNQQRNQQPQQQQHIATFTPPIDNTASPATSHASNTSSLLSKRLGAERAAALAIDGSHGGSMAHSHGGKWKRQSKAVPGIRMGPDGMPSGPPGSPGFFLDDGDHMPLPATPGWLPKLTPTRRGDDLFLNVQ